MQAEAAAGKPALPGLPAFRDGDGVETLTLTLRDVFGLEVQLRYTVYEAEDLITRTAVYTNTSSLPLTLHKAASLCLDFAPGPMDLITLNGTWAAERTPERAPLRWGIQSIGSTRGIPGHAHNPAAILCTPDCTETAGSCWGFALVYSGNFLIEAQRADAGQRLVMGIHPYHFHWQLEPGASFAAPEAAMVYSDQGLGERIISGAAKNCGTTTASTAPSTPWPKPGCSPAIRTAPAWWPAAPTRARPSPPTSRQWAAAAWAPTAKPSAISPS